MGLAGLVRLAGSLTVLAAATGLGAAVSLDYRRRIPLLTQLRRMFLLLAGEIRSSRTPAAEAFGRMAGRMEPPFGKWLKTLADRLEAGEGESFAFIWKEWVEQFARADAQALQTQDVELLLSFGEGFGYLDQQMQLSSIQFVQEQLLDRVGELRGGCAARMRMARLLGVSAGIFLVILLL